MLEALYKKRRKWPTFTVTNLLMLIAGIAIGLTPFKFWQPPEFQILVSLQIVEIPHDSLSGLGIDPGKLSDGFSVIRDRDVLESRLPQMQKSNEVRLLAEPMLVTLNARPATFNAGGEFPVPVRSDDGSTTIMFQEFGTRVDVIPTLLRNGRIRLQISPQISEIDESKAVTVGGTQVPGVRTRSLETEVELEDGETIAFGGFSDTSQLPKSSMQTIVVARTERVTQP